MTGKGMVMKMTVLGSQMGRVLGRRGMRRGLGVKGRWGVRVVGRGGGGGGRGGRSSRLHAE
jgi:hypothetical protein